MGLIIIVGIFIAAKKLLSDQELADTASENIKIIPMNFSPKWLEPYILIAGRN